MSKPYVLQVIRPVEGGMLVHLSSLVKGLAEDFAFTVACPAEVSEHLAGSGAEIVPLQLTRGISPAKDLAAIGRLARLIRSGSFRFVHAHGFKAGLAARPAARANHVPCLLTVHADFAGARSSRLGSLYFVAERLLSRWTSGYITVSHWLAEELAANLNLNRERLRTIPNGIPLSPPGHDFAGFPFPAGCRVVGTVARLAPQKGVEYFVRAAALLSRYPDLRFVVAGDGPEKGRLEALAGSLGLNGRLFFMGHRDDVRAMLPGLSVFVQPSLSEGQGITVLEAMAAGCPVVATSAGGLTELVKDGDNGLVVIPGHAGVLAEAVEMLLADRRLADRLVSSARETVNKYSLDIMLEKTRRLYRALLEGGWLCEED